MVKAKDIIEVYDKREQTDSRIISENIEKILVEHGYTTRDEQIKWLAKTTESSIHACHSWLNASRGIKIPFIKMCIVANVLDVDLEELLE